MQLLGKMRSRPKETGDKRNSWNKQAGVAPTTGQQRSQLLLYAISRTTSFLRSGDSKKMGTKVGSIVVIIIHAAFHC